MSPPPAETPTLRWSDAALLGYGPMDATHEEFVHLLGELQCASDAQQTQALERFADHLRAHFEQEDGWMASTGFPPRDCHVDEHAAVMASVQQVRALLAQGDHKVCRRLADELARWFPGHADYLDSALAAWMCKQQLGAQPVVVRRRLDFEA